ncbi:hypothetical protein NDU88_001671 [Pleurodeles waltl]|uniref:Uncharacterized protein n=1 Tax=Pleurodeles waltl TaxID=8319 RepID=A0AAV7Q7U1_PLEWA|nr:hypothetical protein NDU88_001671 [Pleurodeles waltl]
MKGQTTVPHAAPFKLAHLTVPERLTGQSNTVYIWQRSERDCAKITRSDLSRAAESRFCILIRRRASSRLVVRDIVLLKGHEEQLSSSLAR